MRNAVIVTGLSVAGLSFFLFATPACGCSSKIPARIAHMKSELRNLDTQQEWYFDEHGTYARNLAALEFTASEPVVVTILYAGRTGWGARATHPGLESSTSYRESDCVAARGDGHALPSTTLLRRSPTAEQFLQCDGWRHSRWQKWRRKLFG